MAAKDRQDGAPVEIKKYANRRLYNTASSSYVTLEDLAQMVKNRQDFIVRDAKSGEDITRSVLTQIIFEEESKGHNLLPINFLRDLIRMYDDSLKGLVPNYLEMAMSNFSDNQEKFRDYMEKSMAGVAHPGALKDLENMGQKNLEMFTRTVSMLNPFLAQTMTGMNQPQQADPASAPETAPAEEAAGEDAGENGDGPDGELQKMRDQMQQMQAQLDALAKKP